MPHLPLLFRRKFLLIAVLGFFSGLPLALTASTLTAWLADSHVDRTSIGLFAAIATPYAFKFLWSPLVDGLHIPVLTRLLGRRRAWLLLSQTLLVAAILAISSAEPALNQWLIAFYGLMISTLSATQDIVIDAYRVERLEPTEQGTGAGYITFGYRIGMLVSGAGALYLADQVGWQNTYRIMALIMATAIPLTFLAREPRIPASSATEEAQPKAVHNFSRFITAYVIAPLRDFTTRRSWLAILAFVILYKLADAFMGTMFNPFLLDIGFTKSQIAAIVKIYGLIATLTGTFAGGWLVGRIGMYRALMLCGFTHMLTNFLLIIQARLGADVHFLTLSISLENFTGGMSSAAFIAYLSALCRVNYTATQYALLSSLAAFGRTWLSTPSGALSKALGWEGFFAFASLLALPGLILLGWLERQNDHNRLRRNRQKLP